MVKHDDFTVHVPTALPPQGVALQEDPPAPFPPLLLDPPVLVDPPLPELVPPDPLLPPFPELTEVELQALERTANVSVISRGAD